MGNLARWHHIQASTRRCWATSDQTANCTEVRACGNLISSRVQSDPQGGISCRVFDYDHRLRESTVSGNLSAQGFPSSRNHGAETNMATCTSVLVAWLDSTDCAGILDKRRWDFDTDCVGYGFLWCTLHDHFVSRRASSRGTCGLRKAGRNSAG